MRSDNIDYRVLSRKRLSGETPTHKILRRRNGENTGLSNQQFFASSPDHRSTLPMPLAGRALFQMDQTASPDQDLLWHFRKRSQDSGMDCGFRLCSRGYHQKASEPESKPLHNSTDFKRNHFRKNPYFTGAYRFRLQNQRSRVA